MNPINVPPAPTIKPHKAPLITPFAILLVVIGPIAIDMYLPALPIMTQLFGPYVSASIGIFAIGMGMGQLFFGPLSDHHGRKPIILIGTLIFTLSGLAISFFSNGIFSLLIFRFIQGIGASATAVSCTAMIRDCFEGPKLAQRYSIIGASLNVIPALAPTFGAFFLSYWHWNSIFLFLSLYTAIVGLIFIFFFKETRKKLPDDQIQLTWHSLSRNRNLLTYALCCVCGLSLILSYVSSAPRVLMEIAGVGETRFAFYFGMNALLIIFGNLISARLVMRFHPRTLLQSGLLLWGISGIIMLFMSNSVTPMSYLLPIGFASLGFPFVLGPANSLAMRPFKHGAGRAAAFIGCSQMIIGSSISILIGLLPINPKVSYGSMAVVFAILCTCVVRYNQKREEKNATLTTEQTKN